MTRAAVRIRKSEILIVGILLRPYSPGQNAELMYVEGVRRIATLILPSDTSWGEGGIPAKALPVSALPAATPPRIAEIARILRSGEPTALVVAGNALEVDGLAAAHRIAALTQARLVAPTFNRLIQRGRGRHPIPLLPYLIDHALAALSGIRHLVLVGAQEPAGFFAYPGKPSLIRPDDAIVHVLARADEDAAGALMALSSELGAAQVEPPASQAPEPASGAVSSSSVAQTLAALIPEDAIVVTRASVSGCPSIPGQIPQLHTSGCNLPAERSAADYRLLPEPPLPRPVAALSIWKVTVPAFIRSKLFGPKRARSSLLPRSFFLTGNTRSWKWSWPRLELTPAEPYWIFLISALLLSTGRVLPAPWG
jgi:hypothetical protein